MFQALWQDNRYNRAPLLSTILLRMVIAVAFVLFIIENIFKASTALMVGIAIILVCMMMLSLLVEETVHFYGTYFYTEFTLP